jgi:hypothetical protein
LALATIRAGMKSSVKERSKAKFNADMPATPRQLTIIKAKTITLKPTMSFVRIDVFCRFIKNGEGSKMLTRYSL